MLNGALQFGSEFLPGVASRADTLVYLLTPTLAPPAAVATNGAAAALESAGSALPIAPVVVTAPTLTSLLSSIYAFDLALGNEDRHLGNYLSVEVAGTKRLYAFDYSRALFFAWPLSLNFPLQHSPKVAPGISNTLHWGRILRQHHGFDLQSALRTVDRLANIDVGVVSAFIAEMPSDWLPDPRRSDFIQWWTDGRRTARLDALRTGLSDASLL